MTGTRAVIAAVGVALVLEVAACSGSDPEPRIAPPSSSAPSSPSTSPAASETAPSMPPEARGRDAKAAEAFVKFYWEMVNYAQTTGDVEIVRSLGDECKTCDSGLDSIAEVYQAGGQIRGGSGTLSDFSTHFLKGHDGRAVVEFVLSNSRQVVDYPGESRDVRYPAGELAYQLLLHRVNDGWRVLFLGEQ